MLGGHGRSKTWNEKWCGVNVMNCEIVSPDILEKNGNLGSNCSLVSRKNDHNLGFRENRQFFSQKIGENRRNSYYNIDPLKGSGPFTYVHSMCWKLGNKFFVVPWLSRNLFKLRFESCFGYG
jgi:hypothetical protein